MLPIILKLEVIGSWFRKPSPSWKELSVEGTSVAKSALFSDLINAKSRSWQKCFVNLIYYSYKLLYQN
jgi:hypothetical protein